MIRLTVFLTQLAGIAAVTASAEPVSITLLPSSYEKEAHEQDKIDPQSHHCLTEAIYWEGRNQDGFAMAAIGHVIMNRVRSPDFPDAVCDVVHQGPLDGGPIELNRCQFSYYCDGKSDTPPLENILEITAWDFSHIIAELILYGESEDLTSGSTYYHATYVEPFWSKEYQEVAMLGDHIFYRHY